MRRLILITLLVTGAAPGAAFAAQPAVEGRSAFLRDVRPSASAQPFTQVVTAWPDGSGQRVVAGTSTRTDPFHVSGQPNAADVGPDGRVAFLVDDEMQSSGFARSSSVAIADADGSNKRILLDLPTFDYAYAVRWSPDGEQLLVDVIDEEPIVRSDGTPSAVALLDVRIVDVDTGASRVLADPVSLLALDQAFGGTWSPDGEHVAYFADFSDRELKIVKPDGTGRVTVPTPGFEPIGPPVWVAGGTRLAFVGRPDSGTERHNRLITTPVPGRAPEGAPPITCITGCSSPDRRIASRSFDLIDADPAGTVVKGTFTDFVEREPPASTIELSETVTWDAATGQLRDVSSQNLMLGGLGAVDAPPVIYLPGFLGSTIDCRRGLDDETLWLGLPRIPAAQLALGPDGRTNAPQGDDPCPEVRLTGSAFSAEDPTRQVSTGLLEFVVPSLSQGDIYGGAVREMRRVFGRRAYFFPWDWRSTPDRELARLDQLVELARDAAGTQRVTFVGHSFGGLLASRYLSDPARAAKVARVMTLGTPYWGAPKTFFTLAGGVETPLNSELDALFPNDELQLLARNLLGAFWLYPSASFGSWLHAEARGGGPLAAADVREVVGELGGNRALFDEGQAAHAAGLDRIDVPGVPWQVVASGGVPTPVRVSLLDIDAGFAQKIGVSLGSGDGTVPLKSASLGTSATGGAVPGGGAEVTTVCGIGHVPLGGDTGVIELMRPYLVAGERLTREETRSSLDVTSCPAVRGTEIVALDIDLTQGGAPEVGGASVAADAGGSAISPADAEKAGLVDLVRVGRQTTITVPAGSTLTLGLTGPGAQFVVRSFGDGTKGAAKKFTPNGVATLDFAGGDAAPAVEGATESPGPVAEDDLALVPPSGGGGGSGGGGSPDPGSVLVPPGPAAPGTPTGSSPPAPATAAAPAAVRDRVAPRTTARVTRRGKRFRITLRATDAGGVREIRFRIGKAAAKRYRGPVTLTRKQATAMRFFAIDRAGNRESPRRLTLPRR